MLFRSESHIIKLEIINKTTNTLTSEKKKKIQSLVHSEKETHKKLKHSNFHLTVNHYDIKTKKTY